MKHTFVIVWFVLFTALARSDDSVLSQILGEQIAIVEKVEAFSKFGSYDKIYNLLGSEYKSVVTKEVFIRTSQNPAWRMSKLQIGTLHQYSMVAYVPVRCVVISDRKEEDVDSVVFFVKEETGWKMQNFPFLAARLPDFAVIPKWLQ